MSHEDDLWILASNLMPYLRLLIDPTDVLERVDYGKICKTFRICKTYTKLLGYAKNWGGKNWQIVDLIPDEMKPKWGKKVCWDGGARSGHKFFVLVSYTPEEFLSKYANSAGRRILGGKLWHIPNTCPGPAKSFLEDWQKREQHEKYLATDFSMGFDILKKAQSTMNKRYRTWHKD